MTHRTLLLHVDDSAACAKRTQSCTTRRAGSLRKPPYKGAIRACHGLPQYPSCSCSSCFSRCSCVRMYSRITASSNRAYAITTRPEIQSDKIALPPILLVNHDRRFALQLAYRIGHAVLWPNPQAHLHVIRHDVPFHQFNLKPATQLLEHLTNAPAQHAEH
jgi:hypothetical protein